MGVAFADAKQRDNCKALLRKGAARENRKSVSFWRALSARAMVVAPTMQPGELCPALALLLCAFFTLHCGTEC